MAWGGGYKYLCSDQVQIPTINIKSIIPPDPYSQDRKEMVALGELAYAIFVHVYSYISSKLYVQL